MASVLAIVSKAVFDDLPVWRIGQICTLDRYKSKNPAFAQLGDDDAIFLVTVRDGDALWLVAMIEDAKKKGDSYVGSINRVPITDITKSLPKLVLASSDGIKAKKGKLGMSLQTPRVLAAQDVELLRKAAPKTTKKKTTDVVQMDLREATKRKKAKRAAAELETEGSVPNKGGKPSPAAQKLIDQVYASPNDRGLRAVAGDKLLEEHHVWGELISLQMADPKKHRKRIDEIVKKFAPDIVGDLHVLCRRGDLELVDGFVAGCETSKSAAWHGVGRAQWEKAASARQWATVERVYMNDYYTPIWWIEAWIQNPALRNLRSIKTSGGFGLERATPRDPWRLIAPKKKVRFGADQRIVALLRGLGSDELGRIPTPETQTGITVLAKARETPKPKQKEKRR